MDGGKGGVGGVRSLKFGRGRTAALPQASVAGTDEPCLRDPKRAPPEARIAYSKSPDPMYGNAPQYLPLRQRRPEELTVLVVVKGEVDAPVAKVAQAIEENDWPVIGLEDRVGHGPPVASHPSFVILRHHRRALFIGGWIFLRIPGCRCEVQGTSGSSR